MQNFSNVEELRTAISGLPLARMVDAGYRSPGGRHYIKSRLSKAIITDDDNPPMEYATVSNRYSLIQHDEAFTPLVDAIELMGVEIEGTVNHFKGRANVKVMFPETSITPEDNKPITMGTNFNNSFDKTKGYSGTLYFLRLICTNGMSTTDTIGGFSIRHLGETELMQVNAIDKFLNSLEESLPIMTQRINTMIEDVTDFETATKIVEKFITGKKAVKWVLESEYYRTESGALKREISEWDIYNSITDYTSNELNQDRITSVNRHEGISRKLLNSSIEDILQVIEAV